MKEKKCSSKVRIQFTEVILCSDSALAGTPIQQDKDCAILLCSIFRLFPRLLVK